MKAGNLNVKIAVTRNAFLFCFLSLALNSAAQQKLADTEIYLLNINQTDSGLTLDEGRLLTNHAGYDDQPAFSYDGHYLYYASERDDYKTDIYAVYLPQLQNVEFISTGTVSEFSPQQKPDMTGISLVRADDAMNTRQIWFYGTDGTNKCLTPDLTNAVSYTWLSDTTIALLTKENDGTGNALSIFNLRTNLNKRIANGVGTSVAKIPSENGTYFTQTVDGLNKLVRHYYDAGTTDTLLHLPGGAKDFCVGMDGSLWAAHQGVIYRWPRAAEKWDMLRHLGHGALGGAYRVAISRDLKSLAVVTEMKKN